MPKAKPVVSGRTSKHPPKHMFQEAAAFAARAHRHQLRKDGRTPYVSHVMRVALTVTQVFGCDDPVVLAAALLHDTIEDTTTDYDDLAERFGEDVADCVAALTKNMTLPEEEREREYDGRLAKADWRARLVKIADVYDNFCDVESWPKERQAHQKGKAYEKCLRALELAKGDAQPAIRAAVAELKKLIGAYQKMR
jgi:(p)ppGpp synthase/HD superfamily hydrolase